jgi:hypothetical protein
VDPADGRFVTELEVLAVRAPRREIGGLMRLLKRHTLARPRTHKVVHLPPMLRGAKRHRSSCSTSRRARPAPTARRSRALSGKPSVWHLPTLPRTTRRLATLKVSTRLPRLKEPPFRSSRTC